MEENKISKRAMTELQKCLLTLMIENTKAFHSDFIHDIDRMNELNKQGKLTGKYIYMSRENGSEFERPNNERITHDWGGVNKKYEIDFDKLGKLTDGQINEINYFDLLTNKSKQFDSPYWVITEIK